MSVVTGIFFFQAEDGIRDYKVTGVQTCALPIYEMRTGSRSQLLGDFEWRGLIVDATSLGELDAHLAGAPRSIYCGFDPTADSLHRSEERRVGKECRSRGSPYH